MESRWKKTFTGKVVSCNRGIGGIGLCSRAKGSAGEY